tara:strand:+ start:59311 stop:59631 length:321 start_codon:yes stop_codon:yes gene_type:complete
MQLGCQQLFYADKYLCRKLYHETDNKNKRTKQKKPETKCSGQWGLAGIKRPIKDVAPACIDKNQRSRVQAVMLYDMNNLRKMRVRERVDKHFKLISNAARQAQQLL